MGTNGKKETETETVGEYVRETELATSMGVTNRMTEGEVGYTIRRENVREGYDNIEREGCLSEIEGEGKEEKDGEEGTTKQRELLRE
jgi:hypothetical protein